MVPGMNQEYTDSDFSECLERVTLPAKPRRVLYAYGKGDDGWSGGFIAELENGQVALITGWCDYTGWG